MKPRSLIILILITSVCIHTITCQPLKETETPDEVRDFFAGSVQQFSDRLFFANISGQGNVMISPLSVFQALSMTANGAAGTTEKAMLEVLAPDDPDLALLNLASKDYLDGLESISEVQMNIANSIFLNNQAKIDAVFLQTTKKTYGSETKALDFYNPKSEKTINDWVKKATKGTIDSIIDTVEPDMIMYLLNAIYFKADWNIPFDAYDTYDQKFSTEKKAVMVPFMHQSTSLPYLEDREAQMLILSYKDERFAFVAILPPEGTPIRTWLENQKTSDFSKAIATYPQRAKYTRMRLSLPKFEARYTKALSDEMKQLGMGIAFDPQHADFSNMLQNRSKEIVISEILHKTFIRVDEKGSEAAAVTAVMMKATSMAPQAMVELHFNRPFFYAIVDTERSIPLFMGILDNPEV